MSGCAGVMRDRRSGEGELTRSPAGSEARRLVVCCQRIRAVDTVTYEHTCEPNSIGSTRKAGARGVAYGDT
jgi:hypothetical protein